MGRRGEGLTMCNRAPFAFFVRSSGAQGVGGTGQSVYRTGGPHVLRYALVGDIYRGRYRYRYV